jgi:hypothetical protein
MDDPAWWPRLQPLFGACRFLTQPLLVRAWPRLNGVPGLSHPTPRVFVRPRQQLQTTCNAASWSTSDALYYLQEPSICLPTATSHAMPPTLSAKHEAQSREAMEALDDLVRGTGTRSSQRKSRISQRCLAIGIRTSWRH